MRKRTKKEPPPHSGTIRVTWAQCPNRDCQSRAWDVWDVDFEQDQFCCGTCGRKLLQPVFLCTLIDIQVCPLIAKKKCRLRDVR